MSVCLSLAAFPHYCTDPNVTWGNGRLCPLVVHCWANLQSVHGFHCYDNIAPKCQRVLVLALCLVRFCVSLVVLFLWCGDGVGNTVERNSSSNQILQLLAQVDLYYGCKTKWSLCYYCYVVLSVLYHWWLGDRRSIQAAKKYFTDPKVLLLQYPVSEVTTEN